jgi:hypothetical protein
VEKTCYNRILKPTLSYYIRPYYIRHRGLWLHPYLCSSSPSLISCFSILPPGGILTPGIKDTNHVTRPRARALYVPPEVVWSDGAQHEASNRGSDEASL